MKERALRKQSPPPEQKSTNAKVARKKANLAKDSGYATHPEKDILQRQSACLKQNSPQRLSIAPKKSTNNKVTRKKANLAKVSGYIRGFMFELVLIVALGIGSPEETYYSCR